MGWSGGGDNDYEHLEGVCDQKGMENESFNIIHTVGGVSSATGSYCTRRSVKGNLQRGDTKDKDGQCHQGGGRHEDAEGSGRTHGGGENEDAGFGGGEYAQWRGL